MTLKDAEFENIDDSEALREFGCSSLEELPDEVFTEIDDEPEDDDPVI